MERSKKELTGKFFNYNTDSVIKTILEGRKGEVFVDNNDAPKMVFGYDGIYGYFDGSVTDLFVKNSIEYAIANRKSEKLTLIPGTEMIGRIIEEVIENIPEQIKWQKKKRFLMAIPDKGFDIDRIQFYISLLPKGMMAYQIDEVLYNEVKADEEMNYLLESHDDYESFRTDGVGYIIKDKDSLVAGAVSYSTYSHGVEMIIKTNPNYRGNGLATVVAAMFIKQCIQQDKKVIWDAANLVSVQIAEKMGYDFEREYFSYQIDVCNQ